MKKVTRTDLTRIASAAHNEFIEKDLPEGLSAHELQVYIIMKGMNNIGICEIQFDIEMKQKLDEGYRPLLDNTEEE